MAVLTVVLVSFSDSWFTSYRTLKILTKNAGIHHALSETISAKRSRRREGMGDMLIRLSGSGGAKSKIGLGIHFHSFSQ
jgi:hypothetical protein